MKNKPASFPVTAKPRRLTMPPNVPEDPPEAWRQGNFLILRYEESGENMIVDISGFTLVRHFGAAEVAFTLVNGLLNVKTGGQPLYDPHVSNVSDKEFLEAGMEAFGSLANFDPMDDIENAADIYSSARDDFLNDLIKPPKKKD